MKGCKNILYILIFLLHLRKARSQKTQYFSAEYPSKIFPYSTFTIKLQASERLTRDLDMSVSIDLGGGGEANSEPFSIEPGGHVTIPFETEDIPAISCSLKIVGTILGKQQIISDILPTGSTAMSVIIKTDKPAYKPGDTVYFLYSVLDGFLRPMGKENQPDVLLQSPGKAYALDKEASQDSSGFSNSMFVIPSDGPLGDWMGVANYAAGNMQKFVYFQVTADGEPTKREKEEIGEYVAELEKVVGKLTKDEKADQKFLKPLSETLENLKVKFNQLILSKDDPKNEIENLKFQLAQKEERISVLENNIQEITNEKNSTFLIKGLSYEGKVALEDQVDDYIKNNLGLDDIDIKKVVGLSSRYSLVPTTRVKVDKPETAEKIKNAQRHIDPNEELGIVITDDDADFSCEQECDYLFSQTKRSFKSKIMKGRKGKLSPKQKKKIISKDIPFENHQLNIEIPNDTIII